MRAIIIVLAAAVAVVVLSSVPAESQQESPPTATAPQAESAVAPTLKRRSYYKPSRTIIIKSKFTPDSHIPPPLPDGRPSPRLQTIMEVEADRWGISTASLSRRIACESGYEYTNTNPSGAAGLGQFMPETWSRAVSDMPRRIRLIVQRWRTKHVVRFERYSDGRLIRTPRWRVRQRIMQIKIGMLPPGHYSQGKWVRGPSVYHGWANVRGTARAIAGVGRVSSSEWVCGV